jgi:hypothetical protein
VGFAGCARQFQRTLATCDSHNLASVRRDIAEDLSNKGITVCDWLLGVIREHGPGGTEAEDAVELRLE